MRHRARVLKATSSATPDAPKVTKLTGIEVEEVSIVDKPAIRRKFLMVKRLAGASQQPEPEHAPMKLSPESKQSLTKQIDAARAALEQMTAAVGGAEETPGAEMPAALSKALSELGALISATSTTPPASPAAPSTPPATTTDDVEKSGRKISQANQQKLEAAMNALKELFTSVAGEPDAPPEIAATAKSATPPAAPAPPAPSSEIAGIEKAIGELASTMTSLTKAVRTQRARLDEVCNATPDSRQVNLDKAAARIDAPPDDEPEFTWSMDMNRPLGKENVPVEKRF